jgi:5-methylcytosine-specific restriction protein B
LALEPNALQTSQFAEAFDRALQVWGTSTNLTMGLFWIRPDTFVNLDQTNRSFLKIDLPPGGLTADFYRRTVEAVRKQGRPLAEISIAGPGA